MPPTPKPTVKETAPPPTPDYIQYLGFKKGYRIFTTDNRFAVLSSRTAKKAKYDTAKKMIENGAVRLIEYHKTTQEKRYTAFPEKNSLAVEKFTELFNESRQ